MRALVFLLVMMTLSLASAVRPAFAPEPRDDIQGPAPLAEIEARLERTLGSVFRRGGAPGASAAVMRDGEIAARWTDGVRAAFSSNAVDAETRFEAASLSKPLTAYAVLQLVDAGALDLDAPILRAGHSFTLRQLLSHSAGFDNALDQAPEPRGEAGAFAYSGAGFLVAAEEIERVTGRSFQSHMNDVVLPMLAMTHSSFGAQSADGDAMALPSLEATLPAGAMFLIAAILGAPLLLVHAGVARLFRLNGSIARKWVPLALTAAAFVASFYIVHAMFGDDNRAVIGVICLSFLTVSGAAAWMLSAGGLARRFLGAVLALLLAAVFVVRPAMPLSEREAHFLPAAGLRTTPSDYALFLRELMNPRHIDPALIAEMLSPQVEVNQAYDWGLGVGLQRGEPRTIWHWGINFPGYQAFAAAWPETGDAVVIFLNGGALSVTPDGFRYAGLEAARDALIAVQGGRHGAYWQGVQ